jgi:ABC-type multidrug transport system fused ATPase/permease subunit
MIPVNFAIKERMPIVHDLVQIWCHLTKPRKLQLGWLLIVMIASGACELLSLGSVVPFLIVLSNPNALWEKPIIQSVATEYGLNEASELIAPTAVMFIAASIVAACTRLANLKLSNSIAALIGSDLSAQIYSRTLYQPYIVHVQRNSSTVVAAITSQVSRTVATIASLLQAITAFFVSIGLLTALIMIDLRIATFLILTLSVAYTAVALSVRSKLLSNSINIAKSGESWLKILQEGLGAIREILLDGSQEIYVSNYKRIEEPTRQLIAKNSYLTAFPRYALDALGMIGIAGVGWWLVNIKSSDQIVPLLGALAFGAQRLLPAIQQLYGGWATVTGNSGDFSSVLGMLNQPLPKKNCLDNYLVMKKSIKLSSVSFKYSKESPWVLKEINVEILHGQCVGIVGTTGSGKSTTLDIVMGLLIPTSGYALVDGIDINDPNFPGRAYSWRSSIAHVPQSIYIADCSIAENIAFGIEKDQIDLQRVKEAASKACIASFIESIPGGYNRLVGERGVQLSGGQKQRIGLARALYKKSSLLVLDEATSALDSDTERSVIDNLLNSEQKITIIMISHRPATLSQCDRILRVESGLLISDTIPGRTNM